MRKLGHKIYFIFGILFARNVHNAKQDETDKEIKQKKNHEHQTD